MPRLHDGRDVDSSSDDWRLHCEARRLLQLDGYRRMGNDGRWTAVSPRRHRQQYLEGVLAARGRLSVSAWQQRHCGCGSHAGQPHHADASR
jgi:hypothetical protein